MKENKFINKPNQSLKIKMKQLNITVTLNQNVWKDTNQSHSTRAYLTNIKNAQQISV